MAGQQHMIMRQVLVLSGCAAADAPHVQSELRRIYYRHLLPAIEKACSRLSAPGRIQRLDRLEVDLGEVPLDQLEAALAAKFDRAFVRELAAAIGSADSAEVDCDLELFSYFIQTGSLPWWAERSDRHLLDASLHRLIGGASHALCETLRNAPVQEPLWRRVALAYPDRLLDELVGALAPPIAAAYPACGAQWVATLAFTAGAQGCPRSVARNLWWEELLRASALGEAPPSEAPHFFGSILLRFSRRARLDYRSLVADLHGALDHSSLSIQPWLRDIIQLLHADAIRAAAGTGEFMAATASEREQVASLPANFDRGARLDGAGRSRFTALLARLPAAERTQALAKLRRTSADAALLRESTASTEERERVDLARVPDGSSRLAPADLCFSDTDAIYIGNAGLVILWPFLEAFFGHLGLTEEKQFKDAAALNRAIGLLQYLACVQAAAPEYLVPLNKVLCGMPLDGVFDFGPPMTAEESEACTDLLAAAIHHAPILHDMSIPGFRASFILREGQLGARDANWLLRVQRETHDIVLDRFPWSVRIVKLPWMSSIMQVEW